MNSPGAPQPFWKEHKELIALIGVAIAALIALGAWLLPRGGDPPLATSRSRIPRLAVIGDMRKSRSSWVERAREGGDDG